MSWFRRLYKKTKEVAFRYTKIFLVVMFLNQLLFFGLCLNPICLLAAMPHVLLITVFYGMCLDKRNLIKKVKESLKFVRESYSDVKRHIEANRSRVENRNSNGIFTGDVHLFVTQNLSMGEQDFETVLKQFKKIKIVSKTRMDNLKKEKSLLYALKGAINRLNSGDIVAIVRGGGDTNEPQFNPYKDSETCELVKNLTKDKGVVTVCGIGHAPDSFPLDEAVNFTQITPTDAAYRVALLIDGGKWDLISWIFRGSIWK